MSIKCLSPEVRDILVELLEEMEIDTTTIQTLRDMAACENATIEYEDKAARHTPEPSSGGGTPRKKRAPTAYQQHTGECMKGGHKTMAECAAMWRAKKGK